MARLSKHPAYTQELSSTFAVGLKLKAVESVQPVTNDTPIKPLQFDWQPLLSLTTQDIGPKERL